jgi:hypothetical protein
VSSFNPRAQWLDLVTLLSQLQGVACLGLPIFFIHNTILSCCYSRLKVSLLNLNLFHLTQRASTRTKEHKMKKNFLFFIFKANMANLSARDNLARPATVHQLRIQKHSMD